MKKTRKKKGWLRRFHEWLLRKTAGECQVGALGKDGSVIKK